MVIQNLSHINPPCAWTHHSSLMQNRSALCSKLASVLHHAPMAASTNARFATALTMDAQHALRNQSLLHRMPVGWVGSCHFCLPLIFACRTSPTSLIPVLTISSPITVLPLTSQFTLTCCHTLNSFLLAPFALTLTLVVIPSPHPWWIFPTCSPV